MDLGLEGKRAIITDGTQVVGLRVVEPLSLLRCRGRCRHPKEIAKWRERPLVLHTCSWTSAMNVVGGDRDNREVTQ
jgi:hypothetical protein